MAQRRMLSKQITETDTFLDLPLSTQALYLHLIMNADDDGFLGNARTVLRMVGGSNDDFKLLAAKQFIIVFDDGITVIKDWRIHNYIQKDRYRSTMYSEHRKELSVDKNQSYQRIQDTDTKWIQDVSKTDTQVRLGKDRLGKDSKTYSPAKAEQYLPYKEIIDYLNEKAGTSYRATTKKTQTLIKARFNEKFSLDDFKRVIDNKVAEWKNDTAMNKFLRPETLFGTKFESYLNQNVKQNNVPTGKEWF
ncbi:MAG: conserved phage C-terminal domain-containing protein [Liquorilactobacillus sp.]|uniref:conserved phage C-terminal domain-containing protein n=1 Tax=Liquorilactobacillus TaxID=2767888 RepID=UPI0039ED0071